MATPEYERNKQRATRRSRQVTLAGQDIGEIPPVANRRRRRRAERSFRKFCETYFADTFTLSWSPDHLRVIAKIEEAVLHGGLFRNGYAAGVG